MRKFLKKTIACLSAIMMMSSIFIAEIPMQTFAVEETSIQTNMDKTNIWANKTGFDVWLNVNPDTVEWYSENNEQMTVTKQTATVLTQCKATVVPLSKGDGTCKIYAKDTATGTIYSSEFNLKTPTSYLKVYYNGEDVTSLDKLFIDKGDNIPINAECDGDDSVMFTFSDIKTLTSSISNGQYCITGIKKGIAKISVITASGSYMRPYDVSVMQPSSETSSYISLYNQTMKCTGFSVVANHSTRLKMVYSPSSSDDIVEWNSSATGIATVADDGTVTGVAAGNCTITAIIKDASDKHNIRYSQTCEVFVQKQITATGLEFIDNDNNPISEMTIIKGAADTTQLKLIKTPSDTNDEITWTSSAAAVATVDATGMLKPVAGGETIITAKAENDAIFAQLKVTVKVPVTSMSITPTNKVLPVDHSTQLEATALPSTADKAVIWKSSDESIATVDALGNVTAVSIGDATITAYAKYVINENSPITAKCNITVVKKIPATSITLGMTDNDNYVAINETKAVQTFITTSNGETTNDEITWTVTDGNGNPLALSNTFALVTISDSSVTIKGKASGKIIINAKTTSGQQSSLVVYTGKKLRNSTISDIADQIYTGSTLKPTVIVYDELGNVISTSNYTITYENNINVGTASVIITGKGIYCPETITKTFQIVSKNTSNLIISLSKTSFLYNGQPQVPVVTVKNGTTVLTENNDYTISISNNINVGTATVTVYGKGNFDGEATKTFAINPVSISTAIVTLNSLQFTYTGSEIKPTCSVTVNDLVLVEGIDFDIKYTNNINKGTGTVSIIGKGNFTSSKSVSFKIDPVDITKLSVTLNPAAPTYTGAQIKPAVIIKNGTTTLVDGTDYTVSYGTNKEIGVGTGTLRITARGNYIGTIDKTFNINATNISTANISLSATKYSYSGTQQKPTIAIVSNGKTLVLGTDFTVVYSNNINAGTATARINGIGKYTGTVYKTYTINPISISSTTVSAISSRTYTGNRISPAVYIMKGTKSLVKGTDYTTTYSNNLNPGTATVSITGIGNYYGTISKTFTINRASISSVATFSSISNRAFTGSAIKPGVTVKRGTTTLIKDTHYTVKYYNNTNIGLAKVVITGKGYYTGSKTINFKIVPKKQTIRSISALSRGFKVTWTKHSSSQGYQVMYATNSSFTSGKTVTITNNYTTTKSITGLTRGKTYYVKVRGYKTVNSVKYYGSWSTAKTVKTK